MSRGCTLIRLTRGKKCIILSSGLHKSLFFCIFVADMYRITREQYDMLHRVSVEGKRAVDKALLTDLMEMTGVRVANTLCGQCWVDATMQVYNVIKRAGYEIDDTMGD